MLIVNGKEIHTDFKVVNWLEDHRIKLNLSQDGYPRTEPVKHVVSHNTKGKHPVTVIDGEHGSNRALAVARYLSSSDRVAQVHFCIGGGVVYQSCDPAKTVAHGCGNHLGNARGINFEIAEAGRGFNGSELYRDDIELAGILTDKLYDLFGLPKEAMAPREYGHCLSEELQCGDVSLLADHCAWSRNRDLGDNGFVVGTWLADNRGWKLVNPKAETPRELTPEMVRLGLRLEDERLWSGQTNADEGVLEICAVIDTFISLGLATVEQALDVGTLAYEESGRGLKDVGWNYFGRKVKTGWADRRRSIGKSAGFFRRKGHKASGDPEWCYYECFDTLKESCVDFCITYCGAAGGNAADAWKRDDRTWFPSLLARGYRGPVTQARPEGTLSGYRVTRNTVRTLWIQYHCGVDRDGVYGPLTTAAFNARYQGDINRIAASLKGVKI